MHPSNVMHLPAALLHLTTVLLHLAIVFFVRHWLISIFNAGLTLLLGLGLIRAASRWPLTRFSAKTLLRLRRFVVLVSLVKGSFYLLQGTAAQNSGLLPIAFGLQFPDPVELLGLAPMTPVTIWNPTAATHLVSVLLSAIAATFFCLRAWQMFSSQKALETFVRISSHPAQDYLNAMLRSAGKSMGFTQKMRLPQLVVANLTCPTPLLLGVWRPYIVLTPKVLAALSPDELELALRHELAHFRRHDHWWRWIIAWIEDVGCLSILTAPLGIRAQALEEELCDRMAVRSAKDAATLASAIAKSARVGTAFTLPGVSSPTNISALDNESLPGSDSQSNKPQAGSAEQKRIPAFRRAKRGQYMQRLSQQEYAKLLSLPHAVVPFLAGRHTQKWQHSPLSERLTVLVRLAQEFSVQAPSPRAPSPHFVTAQDLGVGAVYAVSCLPRTLSTLLRWTRRLFCWLSYFLFGLLLLLISYAKFQLLFGRL